jgi:hypothetical protein
MSTIQIDAYGLDAFVKESATAAADSYFKNWTTHDNDTGRMLFERGFERGFAIAVRIHTYRLQNNGQIPRAAQELESNT